MVQAGATAASRANGRGGPGLYIGRGKMASHRPGQHAGAATLRLGPPGVSEAPGRRTRQRRRDKTGAP